MNKIIIGLCGGTFGGPEIGKKETTELLVKKHGFYEVRFIKVMEETAKRIANWDSHHDPKGLKLLDALCASGRKINKDYWLHMTIASLPKEQNKIVFSDVFFDNEAEFIHHSGGKIIQLNKKDIPCDTFDFEADIKIDTDNNLEQNIEDMVNTILNPK